MVLRIAKPATFFVMAALLSWGCRRSAGPGQGNEDASAPVERTSNSGGAAAVREPKGTTASGRRAVYTDITEESGLHFVHFTGATGDFFFAEIKGPGCGLFDYDNDGDLDVYALQGTLLAPDKEPGDCIQPYDGDWPPRNRLFRNDLSTDPSGAKTVRFTEVTEQAGVGDTGYGIGLAVGDYDNDGDLDLYLANLEANVLYRNLGDGTFEDVTAQAGVGERRWSACASFVDVNHDGNLDLYVVNYVNFSPENNKPCFGDDSAREYCGPKAYNPVPDRLFLNNGDGTFRDITTEAGINRAAAAGIGVCTGDFNGDEYIDIYVANDAWPNNLWINKGDGTFEDTAMLAGAALNEYGVPEAGMGVMAGDFDLDGDEDIFVVHLREESNTLYVNQGGGMFVDATTEAGLAAPSRPYTSFGAGWVDYDNNGLLDLFIANGDVKRCEPNTEYPFPYRQPNQLMRNDGKGKFVDVSAEAGPALLLREISRGAAFGDVDNDGDTDVLITNLNGTMRLLRNEMGQDGNWVTLRLLEEHGRRDAIGAWVGLLREGGPTLWRRVHADGSCYSANDSRVHFGLGSENDVDGVVVHWPSGRVERWPDVPINSFSVLQEGRGEAVMR
jgi:hypothetical protein